jgi:hypothetical protein
MSLRPADLVPLLLTLTLALFFLSPTTRNLYAVAYGSAPALLSFLKFGLLATGGEVLALRLRTGSYNTRGFGVTPKMIVWGVLGVAIYWAFTIFAHGAPHLLSAAADPTALSTRVRTAFVISLSMNIIFAPPMMLTHHLTDRYISRHHGRFPLRRFALLPLLEEIDWQRMWGFVFKKTIPLFWIPAHTVTFLLPEEYRVLFAVLLSVVLGLILGGGRCQAENMGP